MVVRNATKFLSVVYFEATGIEGYFLNLNASLHIFPGKAATVNHKTCSCK